MGKSYLFFSIIIPTYGRPKQLTECLDALTLLEYPDDHYEVIVIDDGSEIPPTEEVAAFQDRLNVTLLHQSRKGPAAARNLGAERAKGAFLAFLDDDCTPSRSWLASLAGYLERIPDNAVGGRIATRLDNPFSTASQIILDIVYDDYCGDLVSGQFFGSGNFSLPVKGFRELGGFDASFLTSEDREFCDRWQSAGYRLTYAAEALVYHDHCLTLRSFWRQQFGYGRGAFRFQRKRKLSGSGYIKPDKKFYVRILRFARRLFSTEKWTRASIVTCLLIIWQLANLSGCSWEALSHLKRRGTKNEMPRTNA